MQYLEPVIEWDSEKHKKIAQEIDDHMRAIADLVYELQKCGAVVVRARTTEDAGSET